MMNPQKCSVAQPSYLCAVILFFIFLLCPLIPLHAGLESMGTEVLLLENISYTREVIKLIRNAEKSIYLCLFACQYTGAKEDIPTRLVQEVTVQSKRGVQVEVILERGLGDELGKKNKSAMEYFYRSGVKVYDDADDHWTRGNMLIVDGFTTVLGTTDWTQQSLLENNELALWIESFGFAKVMKGRFEEIKGQGKIKTL